MAIIDNLNTLEGNLVSLKELLARNLNAKGIGGATTSNTLTQLANMVLDITVGETVTYDLDLTFNSLDNTGKVSFQLNGQRIESTSVNYQANLADLGIDELTSFSFANTTLKTINAFPDTSKVTSLNSKFSNSLIENLDITNWNLDSLTDVTYAFSYMQNVKSIAYDMNKFSQFENVQGLFGGNTQMTYGNFSPSVATKNMSYMFYGCNRVSTIRLDSIDDAEYRPTNVSNMFNGCSNLTGRIDLRKMNWADITDASCMFNGCSRISIPLVTSGYRPSNKLTNTSYMFADTTFDILQMTNTTYGNFWENWFDGARIEDASGMFKNANINGYYEDSAQLRVIRWATKDTSSMFEGCVNMTGCTISNNPQSLENCSRMFAGCSNLTYISFNGLSSENITDASGMFEGCSSLSTLRFDNSPSCSAQEKILAALEEAGLTSQVTVEGLATCGGGNAATSDRLVLVLESGSSGSGYIGEYNGFDTNYENGQIFTMSPSDVGESSNFTRLSIPYNVTHILSVPTSDALTFLEIRGDNLEYINLSTANLSNVDTFSLSDCPNLKYLDLSNWQTRPLNSGPFFNGNAPLKAVKMLNCSSDAVEWIQSELMDAGLSNVVVITEENNDYVVFENYQDYSNIVKVGQEDKYNGGDSIVNLRDIIGGDLYDQGVEYMFMGSNHLTVYTTPSLSSTTAHYGMFYNNTNMTGIDLSTWDINFTDNSQDMSEMFNNCSQMKWLNISNWDLTNAYGYEGMFTGCSSLNYIIAYNCNDDTISKIEEAINNSGYSYKITLLKTQS